MDAMESGIVIKIYCQQEPKAIIIQWPSMMKQAHCTLPYFT